MGLTLDLFAPTPRLGRLTNRPVPQLLALLCPLLIEPQRQTELRWRFSKESKTGWIFLTLHCIGYGTFNGQECLYAEIVASNSPLFPVGSFQEFGPYELFPLLPSPTPSTPC